MDSLEIILTWLSSSETLYMSFTVLFRNAPSTAHKQKKPRRVGFTKRFLCFYDYLKKMKCRCTQNDTIIVYVNELSSCRQLLF